MPGNHMLGALKRIVKEQVLARGAWIEAASDPKLVRMFIRSTTARSCNTKLIRVGPAGDGGYMVPNDLDGITACISPGVSTECGFDLEMAKRGIDVYMADASVEGPPLAHPRFHFTPKFFDTHNDYETTTIDDFCDAIGPSGSSGDLILQMDIEGAEYRVIPNISTALLKRFRIMVVEFHDMQQLFSKFSFVTVGAAFKRLRMFHEIVHIHPNNRCGMVSLGDIEIPRVMEFTFYRKDRARFGTGPAFPHDEDRDNFPDFPPMPLPNIWR
jgi:hypothetical protein